MKSNTQGAMQGGPGRCLVMNGPVGKGKDKFLQEVLKWKE